MDKITIASRILTNGTQSIEVKIYQPFHNGSEWSCEFEIFSEGSSIISNHAYAEDSVQALLLCNTAIKRKLEQELAGYYWIDEELGTGFPEYMPEEVGIDFINEIRNLIEEKLKERNEEFERLRRESKGSSD